jgi:glycosyltransferase involved in cell wall biosynthesis
MGIAAAESARKLHVLLYIDSIHCGGAQRQLCHLAIGLKDLGHAPWVAAYYPQFDFFRGTLESHGIPFVPLRKRAVPTMIRDLGNLAKELQIHWVVSFLEGPGLYALMTKRWYGGFKLCVGERSANTLGKFSLKQRVLRRMYRWADRITTNSEYQAGILREQYPRLQAKIRTIRNCVGAEFLERGRTAAPSRDGWDLSRDWLAVVGQIAPWKNLHGLIDGMMDYRRRFGAPPKIRWAGRPAEAFSDYVSEQKKRIAQNDLTGNIELLGNIDNVPAFLRESAGLFHPSIVEGFPNAVCEAFAVSVPVIIGDISDARVLAADGRGMLFDPHSAESISDALHQFVNMSGANRQRMADAGREFAERELQQDTMAAKYARMTLEDF